MTRSTGVPPVSPRVNTAETAVLRVSPCSNSNCDRINYLAAGFLGASAVAEMAVAVPPSSVIVR